MNYFHFQTHYYYILCGNTNKYYFSWLVGFMVLNANATFDNISVVSWLSVLLEEETGISQTKPMTCHKSLTNFIT